MGSQGGVRLCMESRQASILARSVAHAARIAGAELALRANASGLLIHGVSKAKTACLDVRFRPRFFDSFHLTDVPAAGVVGSDDNVDFAVYAKSLLAVLKKPRLSAVEICFDREHPERVYCSIQCRNGLQMNYSLDCLDDVQVLESGARAERMNAQVAVDTNEMVRLLSAFQPRLSDVRVVAYPDGWQDRNGANRKRCALKLESCIEQHESIELYTELLVPRDALQDFCVREREPIDVSSSLKDIKYMAAFCHALDVDVVMSFDRAGTPLVMRTRFRQGLDEEEVGWNAKLVLATLMHSGGAGANHNRQQQHEHGAQGEPSMEQAASAMARSNVLPGDDSPPRAGIDADEMNSPEVPGAWRSDGGNSQADAAPARDAHVDKRPRPNPQVLVSDSQTTATTTSRRGRAGAANALNTLRFDSFHRSSSGDDGDDDDDDDDEEFIDATPPHRQTGSLLFSP